MMPPTEHQDVRVWHGRTDWTNLMLQPSDSAVTFQQFFGTNRFSLSLSLYTPLPTLMSFRG